MHKYVNAFVSKLCTYFPETPFTRNHSVGVSKPADNMKKKKKFFYGRKHEMLHKICFQSAANILNL